MNQRIQLGIAAGALTLVAACTVGDKAATPADTATGQSTTVAPAGASAPVLSAPVDSVPSVVPTAAKSQTGAKPATPARPKTATTGPKATGTVPQEPMRDSAFKPRATVDEKGNIQPIKRDTLR